MNRYFLIGVVSALLAQPAAAITFPSLTTIYVGAGVYDSSGAVDSGTIFRCANVSGQNAASVAILVLAASPSGILNGWSFWAAVIILMREVFVSGLREFLAELRVSVPVTRLAKWKTTMQLIAVAALLIAPALQGAKQGFIIDLGLTFFWATALVTLYTGFDYFRAGLKHLVDDGT